MPNTPSAAPLQASLTADIHDDGDFSDMLSEQRILLPGAQMLTAFLIILPFNGGFQHIVHSEKLVFLGTFICSMTSLLLLSAPAIQHRVIRPLADRAAFKQLASKFIVAGALALAFAFTLATNLVISEVFGTVAGLAASGSIALLILVLWWLLPMHLQRSSRF
ncbi:DUF6328 family protein [Massilia sp. S19_KUP03_FR1]|uniref:DUF6328 family protein n=1 Tax=Massilia sp. S19_KUP03_FR1 TaxID=3025503 RepID=UPI002FCD8B3B